MWKRLSQPQFLLIGSGVLLILSGLFHIPVWLVDGSSWEGSVSWRKPILFGISTGLTLWSIGWIVGSLKLNRFDRIISFAISAALVIEVGLITIQQWRGTASHFNQTTVFDARVDVAMLVLISIAVAGILYFALRSFGKLQIDSEYAWAARIGMAFLVLSCLIGFAISAYGYERVESNMAPETFGENGVTKFPHGVAIHVLQILPMLSLLLRKLDVGSALRRQAIWCVAGSHFFLLSFACVQTLAGKARLEIDSMVSAGLLSIAVILLVVPAMSLMRDLFFQFKTNQSGASN